ncbi:tryptophan synthase subunit alpha, partial [Candidatus Amarolinea dominans]|uniref:tryptophan synthase subunit alpha n=1 Tax=Candidatus Amarolinea dominans TaxID=3140696 RepID=UPI0031CCC04A
DATAAGVDGVIVPDLPPEENGELAAACSRHGLALIRFLAPTSTAARVQAVTQQAEGFLYLVSLTGVTGAREALPVDLAAFVAPGAATTVPLAVGFGISTPAQAHAGPDRRWRHRRHRHRPGWPAPTRWRPCAILGRRW